METQKQIYLLLSYIAEGQVNMKFYYPQLPSFPLENFLVDMYPEFPEDSILFYLPYQVEENLFYTLNYYFLLNNPKDNSNKGILFTLILQIGSFSEINCLWLSFNSWESLLMQFRKNLSGIQGAYHVFQDPSSVSPLISKSLIAKAQAEIRNTMQKIFMMLQTQLKCE